jgi:hypothetical protein
MAYRLILFPSGATIKLLAHDEGHLASVVDLILEFSMNDKVILDVTLSSHESGSGTWDIDRMFVL